MYLFNIYLYSFHLFMFFFKVLVLVNNNTENNLDIFHEIHSAVYYI